MVPCPDFIAPYARLCICLVLTLASCVQPESPAQLQRRTAALESQLLALSPAVSPLEASTLARTAVTRADELNRQWQPSQLPWFNNFLVNTKLRQQGLCYQWREAIFPSLHALHLRTLDLHLASARRATLREHNGIVVTAHGQPFKTGLILDAWRTGGHLHSSPVATDHYPWLPLPRQLTPLVLQPLLTPRAR